MIFSWLFMYTNSNLSCKSVSISIEDVCLRSCFSLLKAERWNLLYKSLAKVQGLCVFWRATKWINRLSFKHFDHSINQKQCVAFFFFPKLLCFIEVYAALWNKLLNHFEKEKEETITFTESSANLPTHWKETYLECRCVFIRISKHF